MIPFTTSVTFGSTVAVSLHPIGFSEVRCPNCGKLICKWERSGIANLEIKCARCGRINMVRLSTR